MNRTRANFLMLLVAIIWGLAFVAQVSGMEHIHAFALNMHRNFVAGCFLLGIFLFFPNIRHVGTDLRATIVGGICCGIALSVAMALQQYGLQFTTAGKGSFITALYIILVPIGGTVLGHKVPKKMWVSVIIACVGLYFISVKKDTGFSVNTGDALVFLSAVGFAVHILVVDHFSANVDGVAMSCIQFFVAGIMSFFYVLPTGASLFGDYVGALPSILYLGFLSSGVGFTLQIIAQRYSEPTTVSLLMSSESIFGLLGGIFILGELITSREWIGCALMFIAILLAQLPLPKFLRKSEEQ